MSVLCTFSGKFGDILWSLPTVRQIARNYDINDTEVNMEIMPQYKSLIPLLEQQSYIRYADVVDDWTCIGSPHGDQPWQPPVRVEEHYEKVYHLTYRRHPNYDEPLIDFIAAQQGMTLEEPVVPFIEVGIRNAKPGGYIAIAFNNDYRKEKDVFLGKLKEWLHKEEVFYLDVSEFPWLQAAQQIKDAWGFVGCKSANYVLAHGVGQKNIFVYEPHPNRNGYGPFGKTFSNPHWKEESLSTAFSPEMAAEHAAYSINAWKKEVCV